MNKHKSQSGFAHLMILVIILILALIGALGFVYWQNFIQKKDDSSITPTSSNTSNDANNDAKAAVEYKTYTFTTDKFSMSFQYPSTWSINNTVGTTDTDPYSKYIDIKNDNKEVVAKFKFSFSGSGGTCDAWSKYTVLETEPTNLDIITYTDSYVRTTGKAAVSFAFIEYPNGTYGVKYGLTDRFATLGEGLTCATTFYFSVTPPFDMGYPLSFSDDWSSSTKKFSSLEDARQYMDSDEYKAIKKMILSLTY